MIRRRSLFLLAYLFFVLFIITTIYLLIILPSSESEVKKLKKSLTIEDKIYLELNRLPKFYKNKPKPLVKDTTISSFLENVKQSPKRLDFDLVQLWKEANSWVSRTQLLNLSSPYLGKVFFALQHAKIINADNDSRGTQLKLLLTLEGNQQVVFKPKWYEKEAIIQGPVYGGKDRYGSEIVGFYLSLILGKYLTPISVERKLSLKRDVIPVASKRLLDTVVEKNNKTCFFGNCYYCKKEDPVCEDQNFFLTGAVIFNINTSLSSYKSPWRRTYKKARKAVWEKYPENYCKNMREILPEKRIYDLIDTSIFDFLIQNGDRHTYEVLGDTLIWLDNGKGLGNPNINHLDILAPLYQCCTLRRRTWETLKGLTGGVLREKLESMPFIENFLTENHLKAIEERLLIVFATVEYCAHYKQEDYYLL